MMEKGNGRGVAVPQWPYLEALCLWEGVHGKHTPYIAGQIFLVYACVCICQWDAWLPLPFGVTNVPWDGSRLL